MTTVTPVPASEAKVSLAGLAEKAVLTFIEAFIAGLIMNQTELLDTSNANLLWLSAGCSAATVLANGVAVLPFVTELPVWAQSILRVVRTFAATFFTFLVAQPQFAFDADTVTAAAVGGIASALALIKSFAAARLGNHSTTALLPISLDSVETAHVR